MNEFDSICLIATISVDEEGFNSSNPAYGTGFFIYRSGTYSYAVTCAHVVKDAYEHSRSYEVSVEGKVARIEAYDSSIDIAILRVSSLKEHSILPLSLDAYEGQEIQVLGISQLSKANRDKRELLPLNGILVKESSWVSLYESRVRTWHLKLEASDFKLQSGYSGSPVVSREHGHILGIVSHKIKDGSLGIVVSTTAIQKLVENLSSSEIALAVKSQQLSGKVSKPVSHLKKIKTDYQNYEVSHLEKRLENRVNQRHMNEELLNDLKNSLMTETNVKVKMRLRREIDECQETKIEIDRDIETIKERLY